MSLYQTVLMLLLAQAEPRATTGRSDPIATPSSGQQTAIGGGDFSTSDAPRTGRILSRRETRLNTRITRNDLATIGRSSGTRKREKEAR